MSSWNGDGRSPEPDPPFNIARALFTLAIWWAGAAFLIWGGARLLDAAFGWFPTRPSWQESGWVTVWIVAVYIWYVRVAVLVSRD